jgi:acetylornithine deacetylase/succinyl-diaminopimelate desuccinylase-like protein
LGFLGVLDGVLLAGGSPWAVISYGFGIILSIPLLVLAWGLGLNLSMGRLRSPSQGAVDNGAACAILLGLAECLQQGKIQLRSTRVTLALFTGEEVNMQGSKAYVQSREWPLPAVALNLEVMAQNGEYVFWEQDGDSLHLAPTAGEINRVIVQVVTEVTGEKAYPAGPVNSDGGSFMKVGVPATTFGTYDRILRDGGFHLPTDNLERVMMERLPQGEEILIRFIEKYECGEAQFPQEGVCNGA